MCCTAFGCSVATKRLGAVQASRCYVDSGQWCMEYSCMQADLQSRGIQNHVTIIHSYMTLIGMHELHG